MSDVRTRVRVARRPQTRRGWIRRLLSGRVRSGSRTVWGRRKLFFTIGPRPFAPVLVLNTPGLNASPAASVPTVRLVAVSACRENR